MSAEDDMMFADPYYQLDEAHYQIDMLKIDLANLRRQNYKLGAEVKELRNLLKKLAVGTTAKIKATTMRQIASKIAEWDKK